MNIFLYRWFIFAVHWDWGWRWYRYWSRILDDRRCCR